MSGGERRKGDSLASASQARVVSLRPAVSTTDQCVVTKAGRGGALIPAEVVPGEATWKEVLTWPSVTLRAGNASRPEPVSPAN